MAGASHAALVGSYGLGPKSLSYKGSVSSSTNVSSLTYSAAPLGTVDGRRFIIVAATCADVNNNGDITGVFLDDVPMIPVVLGSFSNTRATIWILNYPLETSADITATFAASKKGSAIGVWAAYNLPSTTPVGTATQSSNNTATNITTTPGGILIACAASRGTGNGTTWTNATREYNFSGSGTFHQSGADASSIAGASLPVTFNQTGPNATIGAFASW